MIVSESFNRVLHRLEAEERQLAEEGGVTNWILDTAGAQWLFDFIVEHKPSTIVECGTSVGYSTLWLTSAALTYGGKVISIEKDPRKHELAKANLLEAGATAELILGDAEQILRDWSGDQIDLLFLDANKKGYLPQFLAAESHLGPAAAVIGDNVIDMAERVDDFVQHLLHHPDYVAVIQPIGDGFLVAMKSKTA